MGDHHGHPIAWPGEVFLLRRLLLATTAVLVLFLLLLLLLTLEHLRGLQNAGGPYALHRFRASSSHNQATHISLYGWECTVTGILLAELRCPRTTHKLTGGVMHNMSSLPAEQSSTKIATRLASWGILVG